MEKFPIYHLSFPNQYAIASTMLRFQEHYESPEFRGKIFDLETYMDWYAAKYDGAFTYYQDWNGFNFTSRVLQPFRDGRFGALTRKEQALLDMFAGNDGDFYVIATHGESDKIFLSHECVHGLFYAFPDYRAGVLDTLSRYALSELRKSIVVMGYHPDVVEDESNAYLTTGLAKKQLHLEDEETAAARTALLDVFGRHFGIDPSTDDGRTWLIERIHSRAFTFPVSL